MVQKQLEYIYSLYNLSEQESLSNEYIEKIINLLGLPMTAEMMDHTANQMADPEDEPLVSHITLDDALNLKYLLLSELGFESVVMVQCNGCAGLGGWSAVNKKHTVQDPDCGCCGGRGVQYLPEAE